MPANHGPARQSRAGGGKAARGAGQSEKPEGQAVCDVTECGNRARTARTGALRRARGAARGEAERLDRDRDRDGDSGKAELSYRVSDGLSQPIFALFDGGQGDAFLSRDRTGELVWGLAEHGCPVSLVFREDDAEMRGGEEVMR